MFGSKLFICGFPFELRNEALKSEFLLISFIFDFFEYEELIPVLCQDIEKHIFIELKIIELNNCFECLFLVWRAASTIDQIPEVINDLPFSSNFLLAAS